MDEGPEAEAEEQGGGGFNPELIRSYVQFGRTALKAHRLMIGLVVFVGVALTTLVSMYIPRTYSCLVTLMAVENAVLDPNGGARPLAGAEGLIMRHENLEALIKATKLTDVYEARRPPLLRLKDSVMQSLRGKMDKKTLMGVLVGTLESRITVEVKDGILSIEVEWSDAETCAELAEAAKDEFLRLRHRAEISAFQEKMAILDSHASQLRKEIEDLAAQTRTLLEARAEEVQRSGIDTPNVRPRTLSTIAPSRKAPAADERIPEMRERLASLKQQLSAAEGARSSRIAGEQAKLDELKLRFTPSHPQVITQAERVAIASDVPSELALLRSDVADMEAQLRQREGLNQVAAGGGAVVGRANAAEAAAKTELLPADIVRLLEREDVDPALSAQMSGAVVRYSDLMDGVRASKIALDTAQAAFNHRYQVVIPVEVPAGPIKPKIGIIIAAGLFLSLLIGLALPIVIELRRGLLVERWQVASFQLEVLGDLRLPERNDP